MTERQGLFTAAEAAVGVLGVLGLAFFAVIRFGQLVYCRELGVQPEEIGLTYAQTLSGAAVIVTGLALIIGVSIVASIIFFVERPGWLLPLESLGLFGAFGIVALLLWQFLGIPLLIAGAITLGVWTLVTFLPNVWSFLRSRLRLRKRETQVEPSRSPPLRWFADFFVSPNLAQRIPGSVVAVLAVVIALSVTFSGSGALGLHAARLVRANHEASFVALGIEARRVQLMGNAPMGYTAKETAILLGQNGNRVVLWDDQLRGAVAFNADDLIVISVPSAQ